MNPHTYKCEDCDFHVLADGLGEDLKAQHEIDEPTHRIGLTDCLPHPHDDTPA